MNRRSFIQSVSAALAVPTLITAAGFYTIHNDGHDVLRVWDGQQWHLVPKGQHIEVPWFKKEGVKFWTRFSQERHELIVGSEEK